MVAAPPTGVRIRTRLRVSSDDERVLRQVGQHLARLAGRDLADRCRLGVGEARNSRRAKALTAASTSRWAATIIWTSDNQWKREYRNLLTQRTSLRRAVNRIDMRLAAPIGGREGRMRGYATAQEQWEKRRRRQVLQTRLMNTETRIAQGRVSVVDRTPVVGPRVMRVPGGWWSRSWRSRSGSGSQGHCGVGGCRTRSASPRPGPGPRAGC